jgi:hypothetical protein
VPLIPPAFEVPTFTVKHMNAAAKLTIRTINLKKVFIATISYRLGVAILRTYLRGAELYMPPRGPESLPFATTAQCRLASVVLARSVSSSSEGSCQKHVAFLTFHGGPPNFRPIWNDVS